MNRQLLQGNCADPAAARIAIAHAEAELALVIEALKNPQPEPEPTPAARTEKPTAHHKPKFSTKPVSEGTLLHVMSKSIVPLIREDRLFMKELDGRVEALEQRGYQGVWDDQREYTEGQECTLKGNRWYCRVGPTKARPGASSDWQMTNKGHDNR